MQGYTTFKLEIPNDRTDYIEIVKTIAKSLRNRDKDEHKNSQKVKKFSELAGSLSGAFGNNISYKEIRKNKADKI